MFAVYNCIISQHDLRLVALAVAVCGLATFTAINLLYHVRRTRGSMFALWLGVAATATGFGIWATHFIAMLAYAPGLPSGYNLTLTLVSLVAAVALTGAGFAVSLSKWIAGARWLGGAIVGLGIGVMHFTGMAALEIAGRVIWDPALVTASIAIGIGVGAAALPLGLGDRSVKAMLLGALLLTFAICGLHFTAMAAASLVPDPTLVVSPSAIPARWLAILVSFAAMTILLSALAGLWLDLRERKHSARESDRMRALANAAFEGLLVSDGGKIVTVNASLATLVGGSENQLVGGALKAILPEEAARARLEDKPNLAFETGLRSTAGEDIPVEVVSRTISFAGKPHKAIAIRDLRFRKKAESDIHFLAHHDALTGLPNRNTFYAKLDELIEQHADGDNADDGCLAVLFLDLDRFKEVNDLFGHAAGDALLQTVARCGARVLRNGQMMARLGGDEFAILAPNLRDRTQAGRIAENLLDMLRKDTDHSATATALVSASIGIAGCPGDAIDRATLMSQADTALYCAKAEGRGTYRFFETAMGEQVRDRRRIEQELRFAIARRELSLVYQPQARADTREILGFEALVRWTSPGRGAIPPSVFIPIAEECGQITQIGEWVLREACSEAVRWARPLNIAINVSAVQLHSANFAQRVHEVLFQTGLAADRLELEVTETALIRDLNRALATLRQLKALGVRIAMDDFGTGYSSLANLRAFPFDRIKIDGSFIKAVQDNGQSAAIVRAVLGLGRGLSLPILAEGVETAEELAFLNDEACQEVQGYFLGEPQPIEAYCEATQGLFIAPMALTPRMAARSVG